ncbi:TonB-dependent receptor [Phenylobacterium sp.]|uniref:TonB-dependent receptor n=1 Tax=Phenylobacterium sp. TaxID=1871053 RepID=UPI002F3EAD3D
MVEVRRRAARSAMLAAAGTGALLMATHAARAETAEAQAPVVGEVVVTAQRRAQNIQEVPVSVQAISGDQMAATGIKSTQDLGQITPNVSILSPIGAGNQPLITIRGIGLNDFDTNNAGPNGIYVDDVYISAPGAQNFSMFDISQVQVLKGPQGTLYGRNTSGGALVFTSKRPTESFTADLSAEYGNYNTLQIQGAMGGPIAESLTGRVAVVVNHSDGYTTNALISGPFDNVNNEAIRLQLQYKPDDKLTLYLNSTIGYVRNHPQPYGHIGTYVPGTENSADSVMCTPEQAHAGGCVDLFGYGTPPYWKGSYNRMEDLTNLAAITQFRADYQAGPIVLTSISSWQYDDKYHPEETDASPNNLIQATYGVKSNTYTQEFRAAQNEKDFNWVAGFYYLHENLKQDQPLFLFTDGDLFGGFGIPAGPGAFDGIAQKSYDFSTQITDSAAVFGQGDYNFHDFTLTLGGRYTWERKTFDYAGSTQFQDGGLGNYGPLQDFINAHELESASNFTYRAALAYHISNGTQVYGSIASGFKSGGFNGSFLSNVEEQALLQLEPVKPEKVTSYEIGEKATLFDHRLIFNAAVFYNAYRDEQIFASVPQLLQDGNGGTIEGSTLLLTNAKRAHTEGAEFQITAAPFKGLTIDLAPAILRTRLDDAGLPVFAGGVDLSGKELANAPKFSFTGIVDYRMDLANGDNLDFRWNANYRSHSWFDTTNDPYVQQDGYWLHNLNVTYASRQNWEVGLYARNILNKQYQLTSSDISVPFGFLEPVEGPPATYGVSLAYHY